MPVLLMTDTDDISANANFGFKDKECLEAYEYAKKTNCIISYERSFFRPIFN